MKTEKSLPTLKAVPPRIPEELLPVYDWWTTSGPRTLLYAALAAALALGVFGFIRYRANQREAASAALLNAQSAEDFDSLIANYDVPAAKLARLGQAKAYYDLQDYDRALEIYDEFAADKNFPAFMDVAVIGRAHCLEALGRYSDAIAAYRAFTSENGETHYLTPLAFIGLARSTALAGDKEAGKAVLDTLLNAPETSPYAAYQQAAEALKRTIDFYTPRKALDIFERAVTAPAAAAAAAPAAELVPAIPVGEEPTPALAAEEPAPAAPETTVPAAE